MKADWLCKLGGQVRGPFTVEQLRQMASSGAIDAATEIRRDKDPRWFLAGKVPGLLQTSAANAGAQVARTVPHAGQQAPVARPAPARVRPVGALVGASNASTVPVGVPLGQAVAPISPPRASEASAENGSVGFEFVRTSRTAIPATKPNAQKQKQWPKSSRALIVAASLGGTCLLVAVIVAIVLALGTGGSAEAVAQNQPAAVSAAAVDDLGTGESKPDVVEANQSVAGDRVERGGAEGESSEATTTESIVRKTGTASGSDASNVLRQIKAWNSLAGNRVQFGLKNIARFEVVSIWLATDATGRQAAVKSSTKVASAATPNSAAVPTLPDAADQGTTEAANFVFVELKISNTGNAPVQYQGWNAPADTSGLLIDSAGNPLELVPATETPGFVRLGITSIPPAGSVSDTIVFRAPADSAATLRLVLPKPALSPLAKGYFAIEAPPETLRRKPSAPGPSVVASNGASIAGDDGVRSEFAELQRQIAEGESAESPLQPGAAPAASGVPSATAGQEEMPADDASPEKPPTAEEFDKLLRKMEAEEAANNAESKSAEGEVSAGK